MPQEPTLVIKLKGPHQVQVAGSEEVLNGPGLYYMMLELARVYMDLNVHRHSVTDGGRVVVPPSGAHIPPTPP